MKQRSIIKPILFVLLIMAAFLVGGVLLPKLAVAAEGDGHSVTTQKYSDISAYRGTEKTAPAKDGYVFAGWYSDEDLTTPCDAAKASGEAWAKFVPADVLSVKVQAAGDLINSNTIVTDGALRFATTVDNLYYSRVGFNYAINDGEETEISNSKVYDKLYAVNSTGVVETEPLTYTPSDVFCSVSQYFKTWILSEIPSTYYGATITVKPFWITMDGTKVYGETIERTVYQQIDVTYANTEGNDAVARVDLTRYDALADAVSAGNGKTVVLLQDIEMASTVTIASGSNVTIQNPDGRNITLTKASGMTTANCFKVSSGGTLTLTGVQENNGKEGIVLSGKTSEGTQVAGKGFVYNEGSLTLDYISIKNNKSSDEAAVLTKGTALNVNSCYFEGNSRTGGAAGALKITGSAGTVIINHSTFKNNTSSSSGGAIQSDSSSVNTTIDNCTFNSNTGTGGGAVYLTTGGTCILKNSTFIDNDATGTSGNTGGALAVVNDSVKLTLEDCSFVNNTSKFHGGAIFASGKQIGTWKNLTFDGNEAIAQAAGNSHSGGALYLSSGSNNLTLENVTVKNNRAVHGGGIYAKGTLKLTGQGLFEGNRCGNPYGQSSNASNTDGQGAAIKSEGTLNVTNYIFKNNYSAKDGGAIYVNANTNIFTDCTFIGNKAGYFENKDGSVKKYGGGGGAVYLTTNAKGNFVTTNGFTSVFENNSTNSSNGGAIYVNGSDVSMTGTYQFTGNIAGTTTTAVGNDIAINNGKKLLISDGSFVGNAGENVEIGIVDGGKAEISGLVKGVDFVYKTTSQNKEGVRIGTAGLSAGSNVSIVPTTNCYVVGNQVLFGDTGVLAAAVQYCSVSSQNHWYLTSEGKLAERSGNVAKIGETEYATLQEALNTVTDSTATTITLLQDVELDAPIAIGADGDVRNITLVNPSEQKVHIFRRTDAGETNLITVASGSSLTLNGEAKSGDRGIVLDGRTLAEAIAQATQAASAGKSLIFSKGAVSLQNVAVQYGNGTVSGTTGGAVNVENGTLTMEQCDFRFNQSYAGGGAIYTKTSTLTGEYCNFDGNKTTANSNSHGGAIFQSNGSSRCTLSYVTFDSNGVTSGQGGAIAFGGGTANISNAEFTSNYASASHAGAILIGGGTITLTDLHFEGNHANSKGGAIHQTGATVTLTGADFVGNYSSSTGGNGGGAYSQNGGTSTLTNVDFIDNYASGTSGGGAIWLDSGATRMTLENGVFTNNKANGGQGGAIRETMTSGTLSIKNYTFTKNYGSSDGGAIRSQRNLILDTCSFYENQSKNGSGGAVYMTTADAKLTMRGSGVFEGNLAKQELWGNAINFRSNEGWDISDSTYDYTYGINPKQTVTKGTSSSNNVELDPYVMLMKSVSKSIQASAASMTQLFTMNVTTGTSSGWYPLTQTISPQGGCTDGTYFYQAFINQNKTDETQNKVRLVKYDMQGNKIKETNDMALNHANDITYNSKKDCLVLCNSAGNRQRVTYLNKETLEVTSYVDLGFEIYSIDYNATKDQYVVGIADSHNFRMLDGELNMVGENTYSPASTTLKYTTQGVGSDDNFIYFVLYYDGEPDIITVHDWNGNNITQITLPSSVITDGMEPENISVINDIIYIGVKTGGDTAVVYKLDLLK